tara:strand:+ start:242 stop:610 length:369 start_codon:yes stop_codon:yes gene_type:complete
MTNQQIMAHNKVARFYSEESNFTAGVAFRKYMNTRMEGIDIKSLNERDKKELSVKMTSDREILELAFDSQIEKTKNLLSKGLTIGQNRDLSHIMKTNKQLKIELLEIGCIGDVRQAVKLASE